MCEMPGAPNLDTWLKCWSVFRTVAIMDNLADSSTLDRYADQFEKNCRMYPGCWHICASADIICRTEHWPELRRRLEVFHATSLALSTFDPSQPWNSVIKDSVGQMSFEFWVEELKERCRGVTMKRNAAGASSARGNQDFGNGNPDKEVWKPHLKPKGGGKGKDKGGGKKKDFKIGGKYVTTAKGKPLCFDWNNGGCKEKNCPNHRVHQCQICRGNHRAKNCPKAAGGDSEPANDSTQK